LGKVLKVTLLSINAKYVHSSLAVWYLAAAAEKYSAVKHDVNVVESTINQNIDDIIKRTVAGTPDIIGISVYIWNVKLLPELLAGIRRQLSNVTIILGGPEVTHNAKYWLKNDADYVIQGEGERSFPALLDELSGYKTENKITACDEYVNPFSDEYFANLGGRIAYIETSRGCPFDCAYCLSGSSGVQFFLIDAVKEQIRKLAESGTRTVKFVDRTFNCNSKRAYEILNFIMQLDTDCCFHFEIAADLLTEEILTLLKSVPAGRIQFEIGIQSFHQQTLDAVSRKTDLIKAEGNIRKLLAIGNIHIHVDLIAGLPYESLGIFANSFNRAYFLGAHMLQLGFLKMLHGSKLREQAENWGIVYNGEPPYQIISNPWLSTEDLNILETAEDALQHTYNKGRFLSVLRYVLNVSGLSPFEFFRGLGEYVFSHAMPLKEYAEKIYHYCSGLPNVDTYKLRDCMVCDLLGMVKGKNMPQILRTRGEKRWQAVNYASKKLRRAVDYDEAEVLTTGEFVYVDGSVRDSITRLYEVKCGKQTRLICLDVWKGWE